MRIGRKQLGCHPALAGVVLALAALVAVATIVAAIRQGSWEPVWATGWLPAVLVGSLGGASSRRACRPRLRRRTRP